MLLQHMALAWQSTRALVLPALHQPAEHRVLGDPASESLAAQDAFDLSALSTPCSPVFSSTQFALPTGCLVRKRKSSGLFVWLRDGECVAVVRPSELHYMQ